jgi:outer membrane autotransporter protein
VRTNAYHVNGRPALGATFEQDTYGMTAGRDRIRALQNATFVYGGFLGANRTERTYKNLGGGETIALGGGLYGSWLHRSGWHADAVLRADWYENEFDARSDTGDVTTGLCNTYLYGLSLELGRRLQKGRCWVEPSVQAAAVRIKGSDYMANDPRYDFKVRVGDATAFQTRAQVRAGACLGAWTPYARFGAVRSDTDGGEVRADGRSFTPDFDGFRMEAGVGLALNLGPRRQVYFDYEYNKSSACERPWAVNLGYRHLW